MGRVKSLDEAAESCRRLDEVRRELARAKLTVTVSAGGFFIEGPAGRITHLESVDEVVGFHAALRQVAKRAIRPETLDDLFDD